MTVQVTHLAKQKWKTYARHTIKKVLYEMLQAVLLFWKLLSYMLESWGFTLNGSQCTIIWQFENLKISNVEKDMVEGVIGDLNKILQQSIRYLGITIDYGNKGKMKMSMLDNISKCLQSYLWTCKVQ